MNLFEYSVLRTPDYETAGKSQIIFPEKSVVVNRNSPKLSLLILSFGLASLMLQSESTWG